MQRPATRYILSIVGVCGWLVVSVAAQQPALPKDLAGAPEVIKDGKWKEIDLAALSPLEECRALLMLDHVLNELAPLATAQADLLSAFLDEQKLGEDFLNHGPPAPPPRFTYEEGLKIAVALLRGPMAKSDSATAFADLNANGLQAYEHMYEATCQRKWSEVTEAGRQVRCMGLYLKSVNKFQDFQQWAPGEVERRQKQYAEEEAQRRAAREAQKEAERKAKEESELARAEQEKQRLKGENEQLQQALAAAQQQYVTPQPQAPLGGDDNFWGANFYGAVSNLQRSTWLHDAAYAGAARAATGARVSGWGGGRGRR